MEKSKAVELLKNAVPAKALPDDEIGFFIEAVSMAIKSLEQPEIIYCEQCANHDVCALEELTGHEIMFCGWAEKRGEQDG